MMIFRYGNSIDHSYFIHRCLTLAECGRGRTGINPMVGAVLVRDGKIIAEAHHEEFGGLHAEANLIKKLDQIIQQEDGLYINLEPCCHTQKKTPPCTDVIIKSGIKRVIIGMFDPNPLVAGKGIAELRKNGIEVIGPVERARCEWFNRGFVSLMTKGRPWITLKKAQTRSGAIACDDGSKMKITSEEQNRWSHACLRAKHDAILVGVGTVVTDDPQLTVRMSNEKVAGSNAPLRIILDPPLRIPLDAKIVNGELAKGTMVVVEERKESKESNESKEKLRILQERGVQIIRSPVGPGGMFDLSNLFSVLTTPKGEFHGITSILVEGGMKTWEAFREAKAVDCEVTLIGRK